MDDKYQEQLPKWEQQEILNQRLEKAALEGNLETVRALTTTTQLNEAADIDCGNNYPLKGAALKGHLPVVEFLLSHPNAKKRARVSKSEHIKDALEVAIAHGQHHIIDFFKSHYSDSFSEYMAPLNSSRIDRNLDTLTMKGDLETIKRLLQEMSPAISLSPVSALENALQYGHAAVFDHWLSYANPDLFSEDPVLRPSYIQDTDKTDLVHTALFHKKIPELKRMVDKFKLDLSDIIQPQSYRIVIEKSPESLYRVVQELDYQPSEKLWGQILSYFEELSPSDTYYDNFFKFIHLVKSKQEKEKLLEHIAVPSEPGFHTQKEAEKNKTYKI